ncbi:unnamed protein product [Acanthoscelides obtectus]|uniref:Uncharacterized protein n=1 Tax=Acanthoscelides obtectus TaxID=200917 RepID=A0A9P0PUL4_ACAOB|nr:unnamed protein product [Acanthoscelides obtectus]CAK1628324.1 hypothetical protein AOBTE_LOCUS5139 [Acanthoscelides obtectus]
MEPSVNSTAPSSNGKPSDTKLMKKCLIIKKKDDAVRPLSPQPGPSKPSTSVQEESEETRPSTTNELDSTSDSDNSVSSKIQKINQPQKKKIYSQKYKAEWEQHENLRTGCTKFLWKFKKI